VNHAIKLAQSLFAENYPALSPDEVDRPILQTREDILVYDDDEKPTELSCLVNTGRYRSVIAESLANQLELNQPSDELWQLSEEHEGKIPVVEVRIKVRDRVISTSMAVSKRLNKKKQQIELGRRDLVGFLIAGDEL
jgi:hypothetical protein